MYQHVSASLCSHPLLPVIMSGWCISIFFAVKEISYAFKLSTMHSNMETHDQWDLPCSETTETLGHTL